MPCSGSAAPGDRTGAANSALASECAGPGHQIHWLTASRKSLILKRRDVRVVEGARLEIALAMCDGVLQISITVAKPTT